MILCFRFSSMKLFNKYSVYLSLQLKIALNLTYCRQFGNRTFVIMEQGYAIPFRERSVDQAFPIFAQYSLPGLAHMKHFRLRYSYKCYATTRCKEIHNERKTLMNSDAEYLRGFALFMSELFVHMTSKDSLERYRVLGKGVRELLLALLDHPTPGNVKCVCQILKVKFGFLHG